MKAKKMVSMLAVLGLISGAVTALGAEPGSHDHQATKNHIKTHSTSKETPSENCAPENDQEPSKETADAKATDAESEKCKPEKEQDRLHDHRKMKNL